jgi:hypothetical protein
MTDFQQVTFLGASIRSFNAQIGWGNQTSQLTVNLAEDPTQNDRFLPPFVGTPVYFNYLGWTFGGLLQSWRRTRGEDGDALYTVNVEDPREILNGVNLVISNYSGTTSIVPNLYNIYGYIENEEGFGAANINDNGMQWTKIRDTFNTLQSTLPIYIRGIAFQVDLTELPNIPDSHRISGPSLSLMDFIGDICSAAGRDFFFTAYINDAGNNVIRLITIDRTNPAEVGLVTAFISSLDEVNSSEVGIEFRNETTSKFLVGGPVEKLFAMTSLEDDDITTEDFPDGSNRTIWPYFGMKEDLTGVRVLEPQRIYVTNRNFKDDAAIQNGIAGLQSTTNGLIFDTFINDNPRPFNVAEFERFAKIAGLHHVQFYNSVVDDMFQNRIPPHFSRWYDRATKLYRTDLNELRAALEGQDSWETFLQFNSFEYTKIQNPIDGDWVYTENIHYGKVFGLQLIGLNNQGFIEKVKDAAANEPDLDAWLANNLTSLFFGKSRIPIALDGLPAVNPPQNLLDTLEEQISNIYEQIAAFAQEYFGRQYLVSVPSVSAKFNEDETTVVTDFRGEDYTVELNGKIITNLEPTDGGFVDETEFNTVIRNNLLPIEFPELMLDNGKIQCYARYLYKDEDGNDIFNRDLVPEGEYILSEKSRYIYIKCQVEPQLVFLKNKTLFSPRAVVTLPGFLSIKDNREAWARQELAAQVKVAVGAARGADPFDPNPLQIFKDIDNWVVKGLGADLLNEPVYPFPVTPTLIVVPLRNNTLTYGPWHSSGGQGKTEFEADEQLVPWNFGSYELMNAAANARVSEGASNQQQGETGTVTFAGVPVINIGSLLISGGPYVTDVNVDIGEGGATTTYSFATWTKQFGVLPKEYFENARKQKLLLNKQTQLNFKNNAKRIAQFQPKQGGGRNRNHSKRVQSHSSHPLIAAQKQGSKNNLVIAPPYNLADKMTDLEDRYMASIDTIFTPFSTNMDGEGGFPHFERPSGNYPISSSGLNPYEYPHNFMLMTRADPDWDEDSLFIENSGQDDTMGYKGISLRSPMIMTGWGFDTTGKPVPAKQGFPNQFADDYRVNTSKWKSGPVDCRWDDRKKMWVASGGQLKKAQLESSLPFNGSGLARFYEFNAESGRHISNDRMYVFDWLLPSGGWLTTGTKCWLSEDGGRYYVVNASCISEGSPIRY